MIGRDVPSMPSVNFEFDVTLFETHYTRICYMQETGIRYSFDKVGNDAIAKAIAKLGNEGWEMIGKGLPWLPRGPEDATYFRRQKQ